MIEISSLTKRFGSFTAVDNISLRIEQGEIFSFLGVNGAGKTTTLRMLSGILKPTSGSIVIAGLDLSREPQQAKQITAYIPDRPHVYPGLTGAEYSSFIAELYSRPFLAAAERAEALLNDFSLSDWKHELVENYSHGMRQRLVTCGALLIEPQVLIIDEPMVGLDPHGAKHLKRTLKQLSASGITIFLSTHSLDVAEELSHRLAIIDRGRILATGTMSELKDKAGMKDAFGPEKTNLEEVVRKLTIDGE
jgi:ABC-2 type transport system ATP-binding protein